MTALQELLTKGVMPMMVFRSDDVDATFETMRASGAEVLQEPIDQPWGPRDCAFRDPSATPSGSRRRLWPDRGRTSRNPHGLRGR